MASIKALDNVGITFVNALLGRGVLNGVVNMTFGAFLFTPGDEDKVDPDLVVTARLRMDKTCAKQVHEALGALIAKIEETEAAALAPPSEGDGTAAGKPN